MATHVTPESLVAALHEHLSLHTTLLPRLHAQLGLPASQLRLELEELQTTLKQVVDGQLDRRKKEVEDWVTKCESVERECEDLRRALGGNNRASLEDAEEVHQVEVLPERHERLVLQRDKLHQVYKVKVDQLSTVINRINGLTRTLGMDFFTAEALSTSANSPPAYDQICDPSSSTMDVSEPTDAPAYVDVTPERFQRVEKELARGKVELGKRLSALSQSLELIVWFYAELGMTLPTPDVTEGPMTGGYGGDDSATYLQILARFVARWEEAEAEGLEGDTIGVEGVDPTNGVMEWAETLQKELAEVKSHRESQIQTIFDQLEVLWKRLEVSDEEMDAFIDENRGSTEEVVAAYQAELDRMFELRKERMSLFIINARKEIEALWDDLLFNEDERAEFAPYQDDEFSEELLARHEEEISRLKEERRIKGPLLASINKYFDVLNDEKKLVESAQDQSRLTGKGPRDPGRLLREEKMRKRVAKEKPKLEKELLESLPAWEESRGRPFIVNGVRIVDILMESFEAQAEKENRKKPSNKAVPARATTPSNPPPPPTAQHPPPGSRKHAATPMQSQGPPAKRARTAASGPTPVNTRGANATPAYGRSASANHQNSVKPQPFGTVNGNRPASAMSHYSTSKGKAPVTMEKCTPLPTPAPPYSTGNKMVGAASLGLGVPSGGLSRVTSASKTPSSSSNNTGRMAAAKRRESFRPRPSMDDGVFGMGGMKNFGRLVGVPGGGAGMRLVDLDEDDDVL
ncbi:hypothetical protein FRC04_000716 [Tulasnella sp. 424]|nr:hypothetical protein FRC04_000716 [Tulasnella sp. 424]KAG8968593.1 hypothetical protein FRC05_001518 [Tulasnella sp. 425]